jgi:hypothetical protein
MSLRTWLSTPISWENYPKVVAFHPWSLSKTIPLASRLNAISACFRTMSSSNLKMAMETVTARVKAKVAKAKPEMVKATPPVVVGAYPILSTITMDGVKPLRRFEIWPKNDLSKPSRKPLRRLLLVEAGALYQPICVRRLWI